MKRGYTYILLLLATALAVLTSCQQEIFEPVSDVPEGYVKISFKTNASEFEEVATRAVDPDGGGVNNMILFCFDVYGVFITTTEATNLDPEDPTTRLSGTFEATIPEATAFIHFVANQNHDQLDQSKFYNKSEAAAMETLEASSGRMIYWARKVFNVTPPAGTTMTEHLNSQLREETIMLIRNHAMITVSSTDAFTVDGMAVINSYAFGTVCPWHPSLKFDFKWPSASETAPTEDFVTIPVNRTKLSDEGRTTTELSRYVYEHENTLEDPISVIINGRKTGETASKYYRVLLLDENSDPIMIRRNHNYTINIVGELSYGHDTYAAAAAPDAPATNNIWISIADNIKEIRDSEYSLTVSETAKILDESYTVYPDNTYRFTYTVEKLDGTNLTSADKPEITWVDGNMVGYDSIDDTQFTISGSKAEGSVGITLRPMAEGVDIQEGTVLIKKGRLFRRVKIYTIRTMDFLPAWASAEVFGGASSSNFTSSNVTVMFTVPDECPEEIFPMKVLLSCNKLDARFIAEIKDENGNVISEALTLPIIRKNEEGYGETGDQYDYGYKYVFEVEKAGVQRVYLRNVLYETAGEATTVKIEAPFFESIVKEVTFTNQTRTIIPVMLDVNGLNSGGDTYVDPNEKIYYVLVPQKKNAVVEFGMKLASSSSSSVALGADDEFLLYSSSLVLMDGSDHYHDNITDGCEYFQVPSLIWESSSNGRMMAFRPLSGAGVANDNGYKLRFKTNKAQSEEIVRLASIPFANQEHPAGYSPFTGKAVFKNVHYSETVNLFGDLTELTNESMANFHDYIENHPDMPLKEDGTSPYDSNKPLCYGYRSATFELSNYNPFRFGAVVTFAPDQTEYNSNTLTGLKRVFGVDDLPESTDHTSAEPETVMEWPYRPNSQVDIAIDVTSFGGSDDKSVDPFGSQFDIYIDAPMLAIDKGARYPSIWKNAVTLADGTKVDKFREERDSNGSLTGRFIYTVDADERTYAKNNSSIYYEAIIEDVKNLQAPENQTYTPGNQDYDRRTLPFVVNGIVSQGDIHITSDKEMVVFYDKSFKVNNAARNMKLTYGATTDSKTEVPLNGFVSFELKRNNNRIGVITMQPQTQQGRNCYLRLRAEYEYSWNNDEVIIRYQHTDGTVYTNEVQIASLNAAKQVFDLAYLFTLSEIHLLPPPATE